MIRWFYELDQSAIHLRKINHTADNQTNSYYSCDQTGTSNIVQPYMHPTPTAIQGADQF